MNKKYRVIPIIYKKYNRLRGSEVSAKEFLNIINYITDKKKLEELIKTITSLDFLKSYKNLKFILGNDLLLIQRKDFLKEIKLFKNNLEKYKLTGLLIENSEFKNVDIKDTKILFSINTVQDYRQRKFDLRFTNPKKDIIFSKGFKEDNIGNCVPTILSSIIFLEKKFFPKYIKMFWPSYYNSAYYKLPDIIERFKRKKIDKINLNVGVYNRKEECPLQYIKTIEFIKKIEKDPKFNKYNFIIKEFGYSNNLEKNDLENFLQNIDLFFYKEPEHQDNLPNTIFEAVKNCFIIHIDELENQPTKFKENGINELKLFFPESFINLEKLLEFEIIPYRKLKRDFYLIQNKNTSLIEYLESLTAFYIIKKINTEIKNKEN